jgi:ADP-ribosylglycohydrolase
MQDDLSLNSQPSLRSRFRGCLLAGAAGDALGAAVEFDRRDAILSRFGPGGIRHYAPAYGLPCAITDDTQMTLFTAEGLIRGLMRYRQSGLIEYPQVTAWAYQRWLLTQGQVSRFQLDALHPDSGWLYEVAALHSRRGPGNTCLTALTHTETPGDPARNNSKGCGGVMRMAPVGLFADSAEEAFTLGCELSALTHGHPSGWYTGGALAVMISVLRDAGDIDDALNVALDHLAGQLDAEETIAALERAADLAATDTPYAEAVAQLGEGWVAEEALAIAVYCALVATDLHEALVIAVNHDGDSDSTGAIAGNLLGAHWGEEAIPPALLEPLELRDVITQVADDLLDCVDWQPDEAVLQRYPAF